MAPGPTDPAGSGVIERLQGEGFQVRAPQFPLSSLANDVARLRQVLEFQNGPTIVVGHSYGGQVISALGADAPNVVGLVYIAAFGLDEGKSLGALLSQGPVTPALAHLFTDSRGFAWLSEDDFVNHFAADVDPKRARVLYAVQQALASSAFTDVMGGPAWKSLPTWYLVAQNDEAIPPEAERQSQSGWARPPSRSPRATSRWSPIPRKWRSSSRRRPKPSVPSHGDNRNLSPVCRHFDRTSRGRQH
jgi:pimeloyl-ACP methyl ester carboxylesterase